MIDLTFLLLLITPFRILDHCIKKRLQWNSCFSSKVCKESEYYEDMIRYLRKNLAVRVKGRFWNFFFSLAWFFYNMFLENFSCNQCSCLAMIIIVQLSVWNLCVGFFFTFLCRSRTIIVTNCIKCISAIPASFLDI